MPIVPVTAVQPVHPGGGFDYLTVDAARKRVYGAHHTGLLIADADTGNVLGIVNVGPMSGVAVNPANGYVYTGNSSSNTVSEIDPVSQKILRTVVLGGHIDALQYDPVLDRIYADQDDGTHLYVIDVKTFKLIKAVKLPGHKPEYLQIDPKTHDVYQNIATDSEIAVIDPKTLKVSRIIKTPEIKDNHPLQYDARDNVLLVAGENKVLSVYSTDGKKLYSTAMPGRVDQCDWNATRGWLACAGGGIALFSFDGKSAPTLLDNHPVNPGVHNVAIDDRTGTIWVDWGSRTGGGASLQGFTYKP